MISFVEKIITIWILFLYFAYSLSACKIHSYADVHRYIRVKDDIDCVVFWEAPTKSVKWTVETGSELKLKMFCKTLILDRRGTFYDPKINNSCPNEYIRITGGAEDIIECNPRYKLTVLATGNKMTLELRSQRGLFSHVDCVFTAIDNEEQPPYYTEIKSEEVDSREYGMAPGKEKPTCDCGKALKKKRSRMIINGTDAGENEFPWAASLQTKSGFHFCGGSIITQKLIITAAHCLRGLKGESFYVIVGVTNLKKSAGRKRYASEWTIIHKYYDFKTMKNDIGLVSTKELIVFSNKVGPICVMNRHSRILNRKYVTIIGWGRMGENEQHRDRYQLKKAHVRVVTPFDCNSAFNFDPMRLGFIHDMNEDLCTWSGHRYVHKGDSGSPVVWLDPDTNRYFLVGIVTHAGSLTAPSVNTNVYWYNFMISYAIKHYSPYYTYCTKK